uniref:NADH-ubiquinone oxidoreductase chain 6 n=1 Tax=Acanthopsyche nigraplaga TaxID=1765094 RepID=A0A891GS19_9NEOP|nr:NADH dehydrogenase subunit 6 [Acanthopsyche nigraplaga]QRK25813.1 NADH dehydrogenase subunit 6 [Acanthopsyche nigraplaga]
MLKIIISTIIILISIIMFFMNNPLSMGLMLLIQTLLICLISGMIINTYWFSYILFLIFLGGLLVMFIYVSSIASNELFQISFNNTIFMIMLINFILFYFIIKFTNNLKFLNLSFNDEMYNLFTNLTFFNNENKMNLCKLYNNQTYPLMLLMIIYLFITLLSTVKISNAFQGPLRT